MCGLRGWWPSVLIAVGCSNETVPHEGHDHEEDIAGDHPDAHRDPATEPCDGNNWRSLLPDLRSCNLGTMILDGEILRRVDLSEANLDGARLVGADLFKATLRASQLQGTVLDQAKLISADLGGADLSGASLSGANLTNANLTSALLDGATTDETTTCPDGLGGPCW